MNTYSFVSRYRPEAQAPPRLARLSLRDGALHREEIPWPRTGTGTKIVTVATDVELEDGTLIETHEPRTGRLETQYAYAGELIDLFSLDAFEGLLNSYEGVLLEFLGGDPHSAATIVREHYDWLRNNNYAPEKWGLYREVLQSFGETETEPAPAPGARRDALAQALAEACAKRDGSVVRNRVADALGIGISRMNNLLAAKTGIDAELAISLATYFRGTDAQYWMGLNAERELALAEEEKERRRAWDNRPASSVWWPHAKHVMRLMNVSPPIAAVAPGLWLWLKPAREDPEDREADRNPCVAHYHVFYIEQRPDGVLQVWAGESVSLERSHARSYDWRITHAMEWQLGRWEKQTMAQEALRAWAWHLWDGELRYFSQRAKQPEPEPKPNVRTMPWTGNIQ